MPRVPKKPQVTPDPMARSDPQPTGRASKPPTARGAETSGRNPWDPPPPKQPDNGRTPTPATSSRPENIDRLERRRLRRRLAEAMLVQGHDNKTIADALVSKLQMRPRKARNLVRRVLDTWNRMEVERRPHHRQTQVRRILRHIDDAKKAGAHSAVASFERLLANIQGTMEPVEVNVNVDATIRESVGVVLARLSPERIRALADRQRSLRENRPRPRLVEAPPAEAEAG